MCVFTREEFVDAHAVLLFCVNGKRQTVEVHGVVLSITPYIQKVPPDPLALGDQQTRKCLCHVPIDC